MAENFPKLMTDPKPWIKEAKRRQSRIRIQKMTTSYLISKWGIQEQRENFERQRKNIPHLQGNKDKNYKRLLVRNYGNKKRVE